MYQLFIEYCQENNLEPASERTYRKIFCEEFNLSFFKPKKDICATCHRYNQLTLAEQEEQREGYDKHIQRYRDSMKAKQMDKDRSNQKEVSSVLLLTFRAYYSRKLCVYNLTVWEGKKPNDGHCFCWLEIEGKRGSNEIASCIFRWLEKLPCSINEVSLFSDTCSGKNRNQQMAAMMMWYVQRQRTSHAINIITHNF
ncbi:organic cation transporter protein [Elysia marginata]|uniref:Organic cation transporter protein n=1 Tax=Elysia marginata TaxID=1093978 RepID=A0AAV4JSK3_9GAST|nr:organic cation transporter protein [Elysia marginata]